MSGSNRDSSDSATSTTGRNKDASEGKEGSNTWKLVGILSPTVVGPLVYVLTGSPDISIGMEGYLDDLLILLMYTAYVVSVLFLFFDIGSTGVNRTIQVGYSAILIHIFSILTLTHAILSANFLELIVLAPIYGIVWLASVLMPILYVALRVRQKGGTED